MIRKALFAAAAVFGLAACATAVGPDAARRFDSFDASGTSDFTGYEQVYLAPVTASQALLDRVEYRRRGPSDTTRPLSQRDIDARINDLTEDLATSLGRKATLVDGPGDGVLTVSVVLTDLQANRPTLADMNDEPGLSVDSRYSGGAAAEVTFRENGKTLAVATDSNVGQQRLDLVSPALWGETNQFFYGLSQKIAGLLG